MMRFILFVILLSQAFICLAQPKEFNVYTSFDDEVAKVVERRLDEALLPLNFQLKLTILPSKRSLMMANEKGDAELMRVADISEWQSQYTSNLIRVDSPVITVKVFAISLASIQLSELDIKQIAQKSIGLEKNVFLLDKLFPSANVNDNIPNLLRLLKIAKIEAAIIVARSPARLRETFNLSREFNISVVKQIPLYVYLHKKHQGIKAVLANSFANYSSEDAF
jgi:hypothetical protein